MENRILKGVLKDYPKMLKALHDNLGFDFEKPIDVLEQQGRFTINSIKKRIENEHNKLTVILIRDSKHDWRDGYNLVIVTAKDFDIEIPKLNWYSWQEMYDRFFCKYDFNDMRKSDTCYAVIISQDYQYIKTRTLDKNKPFERAKIIKEHYCYYSNMQDKYLNNVEIIPYGANCEPFVFHLSWHGPITNDINVFFDKSGYYKPLFINPRKEKARQIRAKKEKAAYNKTDFSKDIACLEMTIAERQKRLSLELSAAVDYKQLGRVQKALSDFSYGLTGIMSRFEDVAKKTTAKDYPSIEAAERDIKWIKDKITKLDEFLAE